jgi:NAD(P)-dependent dehydrogenase (short-subunit alcohol dehydrogenase family)
VKRFRDKVVVITGGGSGIGRSTAAAFAAEGARVHVVDVSGERVDQVCGELAGLGGRVEGHVLDCADAEAMAQLARDIYQREGRVDVLQNGVGILVAAPAGELSRADWQRAIDVNLGSVVNGIHAFLPWMQRRGGRAHIVNIASVAGLVAFPYTAPYTATKFAIVGLSESLAYELAGSGIGVTVVCPGMVRSNLVRDGLLELPDPWPRVFERAYATIADHPDRIAKAILKAVRRNQTLVVPATLLPQLWRLERLGGARFHDGARRLTQGLKWLGTRMARRSRA